MRLPMWESDSVAWKLERVSPRFFSAMGGGPVKQLAPAQDLKTRIGTLRQSSVDDGNDSSAIVGGE